MNDILTLLEQAYNECKDIVNVELAIVLGILGIGITIFTVIYSFLGSKLQQKKLTERNIHIGNISDPYLHAELKFMRQYIKRNKNINKIIIWIIYSSLILASMLIANLVVSNKYFFFITEFILFVYVIFFIILIIYYIHIYNQEVR